MPWCPGETDTALKLTPPFWDEYLSETRAQAVRSVASVVSDSNFFGIMDLCEYSKKGNAKILQTDQHGAAELSLGQCYTKAPISCEGSQGLRTTRGTCTLGSRSSRVAVPSTSNYCKEKLTLTRDAGRIHSTNSECIMMGSEKVP